MRVTSDVVIAVLAAAMASEDGVRRVEARAMYQDLVREWTAGEPSAVEFIEEIAMLATGTLAAWRPEPNTPRQPGDGLDD